MLWEVVVGSWRTLGCWATTAPSVLGHLADHVVEDSSVVEVGQLHVRVEPHAHFKRLPRVQL